MVAVNFSQAKNDDIEFEVRAISADESDAFLQLMCRSFSLNYEIAKSIFYSDPFFDLNLKRALIERKTGRVVSCLTVIPTLLRTSKRPAGILNVAGIAGVCTDPDYRHHGYARHLIQQTVVALGSELGYSASALTADHPVLYQSEGWSVCGDSCDWKIENPSGLPYSVELVNVRQLSTSEANERAAEIHRVYASTRYQDVGTFIRTDQRWRCIEKLTAGRQLVVHETLGNIDGYVAYHSAEEQGVTVGAIHEIVAPDNLIRRSLISYLGRRALGGFLMGRSREIDLYTMQLIPDHVTATSTPNIYLRSTHLSNLVRHLTADTPVPSGLVTRTEGFVIRIDSGGQAAIDVSSSCTIRPSSGKVSAHETASTDTKTAWITGSAGALTQMLFGYKSASQLVDEGQLRAAFQVIATLCDQMFPPIRPFLAPPDVF